MNKISFLLLITASILSTACNKRNADYSNLGPEIIKEWRLNLNSANVVPSPTGRRDVGEIHLQLRDDNTIVYEYRISDLDATDQIADAGIYAGDPLTNGQLLLNLNARPLTRTSTGVLTNLPQSLVDSLLNDNLGKYISINTSGLPMGALRAQLNTEIVFAADIPLTGAEEVPPVNTTATGFSSLRLSSGGVLYSRIDVIDLEPGDQLTAAHIHRGIPGQNGAVVIPLIDSAAEFGTTKQIMLTDSLVHLLQNERLYVNVHSVWNPAGKIRGQIR